MNQAVKYDSSLTDQDLQEEVHIVMMAVSWFSQRFINCRSCEIVSILQFVETSNYPEAKAALPPEKEPL